DHEFLHWNSKLSELAYVQLISGELPIPAHKEAFSTPVVVLPSCSLNSDVIVQANHSGLLTKMFSWWLLVLANGHEIEQARNLTAKKLTGLQVGVDSDVNAVDFLCTLTEEGTEVRGVIWDVYKLGEDAPLCLKNNVQWHYISSKTSSWEMSSHFPSYMDRLLFRSHNLSGITLRVGVLVGKSDYGYDCRVEQDKKGRIVAVQGYSAHILHVLMDLLQFKVEFVGSDTWGAQDDEGVWVGLFGLLAENEVDLVLCHPTVTAERSAAAYFLHPTLHSRRMLVYRAAGLPLTQDVFVLTFTGSLWLVCLVIALVLLAASFRIASLQTSKFQKSQTKAWTWVEITLWAVAATCQQGFSKEPQGLSCKAVFIIGYLASYLLYTWFAAGVTSLLAVQGQDTHLQLSDVAKLGTEFSASWDGLLPDFFIVRFYFLINSPDPAAHVLYSTQLKKERNKIHSLEQMFMQLRDDNKVGMASEHPLKHFMATRLSADESCQLTLSPVSGTKHLKAWAVRKNSPYADLFNYWLLRLQETGLLQLSLQQSMVTPTPCGNGPGYSSAGIGHVMSALGILATGIAAAFVLLFAEFVWHYNRASRRR
ncbi:hypothetical protein ANN_04990, partial [Periplaneta americana]